MWDYVNGCGSMWGELAPLFKCSAYVWRWRECVECYERAVLVWWSQDVSTPFSPFFFCPPWGAWCSYLCSSDCGSIVNFWRVCWGSIKPGAGPLGRQWCGPHLVSRFRGRLRFTWRGCSCSYLPALLHLERLQLFIFSLWRTRRLCVCLQVCACLFVWEWRCWMYTISVFLTKLNTWEGGWFFLHRTQLCLYRFLLPSHPLDLPFVLFPQGCIMSTQRATGCVATCSLWAQAPCMPTAWWTVACVTTFLWRRPAS